jgi:large subunit ribosomal protein L13e
LKAYKAKLILFPRKAGKPNGLDSSNDTIKEHSSSKSQTVISIRHGLPINNKITLAAVYSEKKIDKSGSDESVYTKLRKARSEARLVGVREKRAKAKEAEAAEKKK